MEYWNDAGKIYLFILESVLPITQGLLSLERFDQFKQPVLDFVVELVQSFIFAFSYLACLFAAFIAGIKFAAGAKGDIQVIQVLLDAATTIAF
jgi:hypothetical protein